MTHASAVRRTALAAFAAVGVTGCSGGAASPPQLFNASPTPTASPTPGQTTTPTGVPTATPPVTATATPTPTPTASPTPTPTATATATPTPTPASVVPAPGSLAFTSTGAAYAQSLVIAESGYSGTFSETDTCSSVASVGPLSAVGASYNATVTPTAAGSCTITVSDASAHSVKIPVAVTTSGLVVQGRGAKR
jgi:hypothetical protein